jgi:hypothetical protein
VCGGDPFDSPKLLVITFISKDGYRLAQFPTPMSFFGTPNGISSDIVLRIEYQSFDFTGAKCPAPLNIPHD